MKIFFDTNVYIAEALLGRAAQRMIAATAAGRWRIYYSSHVLDELQRVMRRLGFAARLGALSQGRIRRRSVLVAPPPSRHAVRSDPQDSPILRAALACGADYLVTNDRHLLGLNPYEGMEIVSMDRYLQIIRERGLLERA
jgi:putative PIN family toxin of toxin-antitoxin system